MEKWMIVYLLPLEVWMDIFCFPWISREKFGQLVDRIGNFKFTEHVQFYLHEWGKRKLGKLCFDKVGLYKYVYPKHYLLEYPQTTMPENIKSFDSIQIKHFVAQTTDFFDKIRPLLTDVEIIISTPDSLANLRTILNNLAPMLNGIRSLHCSNESAFPMVKEQFFRDNEKLAKLKSFGINFVSKTASEMERQECAAFVMNWLALPDTDGPRLLEFCSCHEFAKQLFNAIREEFLAAKTPRTFALSFARKRSQFAEFHLTNGIGEELHGIWNEVGRRSFQITRHRAGWNTKEAREWIMEITKGRNWPYIWIDQPTIGSLNTAAQIDDMPQLDEKQDNQQKPGSSKNA